MEAKDVTSLPQQLLNLIRPVYHFGMACLGALVYNFPSRKIIVIGVTGTKGKSSTVELLNAIFEEADYKTALAGTIRIKIGDRSKPNRMRMTMPGRFFFQRFISRAVRAKCDVVFIEMTSEGARQFRHRCIALNALIFINLAPEHVESHGSYAAYSNAKFELGKQLARSSKRPRIMVANADDTQSGRYMTLAVERAVPFTLSANAPWKADETGGSFMFENTEIRISLPGEFSLINALAAATLAREFGIKTEKIKKGLEKVKVIPGRAEVIDEGQSFAVVVDYAHTPDSLKALYSAYGARKKICVLGSTGGGRDMWKRPVMGGVADQMCEHIILTDEDSFDEKPETIIEMISQGIRRHTPEVIIDRRAAMQRAFSLAQAGDAVLITGKGTDPSIYGPRGKQTPWSDSGVAREELKKFLTSTGKN